MAADPPQIDEDLLGHRPLKTGRDDSALANAAVRSVLLVDVEGSLEESNLARQVRCTHLVIQQCLLVAGSEGTQLRLPLALRAERALNFTAARAALLSMGTQVRLARRSAVPGSVPPRL